MAVNTGLVITYDTFNVIVNFGKYAIDSNGVHAPTKELQTFSRRNIGKCSEMINGDCLLLEMISGGSYFLTVDNGQSEIKNIFQITSIADVTDANNPIDKPLTDKRSLTLAISDIRR